jgi:16S rRNA (uracil1498-N3)-methyltransferase
VSRHFHVGQTLTVGGVVELDPGRFLRVLRKGPGDAITVCDARGGLFRVVLRAPEAGALTGDVVESLPDPGRDAEAHVTVWLPLLKGGKTEDLVRPLTELGVAAITPLQSRHAVVRLDGQRAAERVARLSAIAAESANQCGRRVIPPISPLVSGLPPRDQLATGARGVFFWEAGGRPSFELQSFLDGAPAVHVLYGPEGGLAPSEAEQLAADGWEAFSLGPRVLRAETAVVAGTTLVMQALGAL